MKPSELQKVLNGSAWRDAEDHFVGLTRTYCVGSYLGRAPGLDDEELRSLFSLAMAAVRQKGLSPSPRPAISGHAVESPHGHQSALERQLDELSLQLREREEKIELLTQELSRLKETSSTSRRSSAAKAYKH